MRCCNSEVAQLRNDVNDILEERNDLSNKMDFRLARVVDLLYSLNQKNDTSPAHASDFKGRRQSAKKNDYLWDTCSVLSKDSLAFDSEAEPQLSFRNTHHRRHLSTYLSQQKAPKYPEHKELSPIKPLHAEAQSYLSY